MLISDFENQTGDPAFDKSLTTAFTTSLGQSSYANIYSRLRITEPVLTSAEYTSSRRKRVAAKR